MKLNRKNIIPFILVLLISMNNAINALGSEQKLIAYTKSSDQKERVFLYHGPSTTSNLYGEYFNGVVVNIVEEVNAEWVKVQFVTNGLGEGELAYMLRKDLAFDPNSVEKNTILYFCDFEDMYIRSASEGQYGEIGPFCKNTIVELIGIVVPWWHNTENQHIDRPLDTKSFNSLHVKIGELTGFLDDDSFLRIANSSTN